jgi:hypothetical protein
MEPLCSDVCAVSGAASPSVIAGDLTILTSYLCRLGQSFLEREEEREREREREREEEEEERRFLGI